MADAPRIVPTEDQSRFDEVTEASEESFPASDAPSWTSTSSSIANHLPRESRRMRRPHAQPQRWGLIAALSAAGGALVYLLSRSRRRTLG